jgi:hypothetical protein
MHQEMSVIFLSMAIMELDTSHQGLVGTFWQQGVPDFSVPNDVRHPRFRSKIDAVSSTAGDNKSDLVDEMIFTVLGDQPFFCVGELFH